MVGEFHIRHILNQLFVVASRTNMDAMEHVVSLAILWPKQFQDVADDIVNKDGVSFRLNGAGLKLYSAHVNTIRGVRLVVCGDQVSMYPKFVEQANKLLQKEGYQVKR